MEGKQDHEFYIGIGTVQAYLARQTPFYMKHFGWAEYERNKPILSDEERVRVQPIVDKLNAGEITLAEAEKMLRID